MLRRPTSAEHFHVIARNVLHNGAKSRTPSPDVLPALRELELPWDRSSSAQATKPKRLGATCMPK